MKHAARADGTIAGPVIVFYDNACGFCLWMVAVFLRLDRRHRITTASIQDSLKTHLADIPADRVLASFHVLQPRGQVRSAGQGLALLLRALPVTRPGGVLLGRAPRLAERMYSVVAGHRAQLARLLPERSKRAGRELVIRRAAPPTTGSRHLEPTALAVPRTPDVPVVTAHLTRDTALAGVAPAVPVTGPVATVESATVDEDGADLTSAGLTSAGLDPVGPDPVGPDPVSSDQVTATNTATTALDRATVPPRKTPTDPGPADRAADARSAPVEPDEDPDGDPELARYRRAAQEKTSLRMAFRLIGMHLRPLRVPMAGGLLLLVVAAVVGLGQPLATRFVLETLAVDGPLGTAVLILVALVLAAAVAQGFGQFLMLRSAEDVVLSSRTRLVDRLMGLSVGGMRRQDPGDLMARVTSDTALIRQIALLSLVQSVTGVVMVVGSVVLMVILDLFLFLVTLGVVVLLGLVLVVIMPRIRTASQQTQRNVGAIGNELERVLGSYTTVKAAAAEDKETEQITGQVRRAHRSGVRTALWTALAGMTSSLTVQAAFLVVLGVGGWRVQSGELTVATLIAFLLYAMQLSAPVMALTSAVSSFQAGRAALERIAEVDTFEREAVATRDERPSSVRVPGSQAALGPVSWDPAAVLDDVTFTYPDQDAPALRGVSLTVPATGTTAIVGPSGSGKSSVLKLLEGFYPVEQGRVVVGGRSLGEWDLAELREAIAYVEQETPILAGSLRDNLLYGQDEDDVDDDEIMSALEETGLQRRIASLDAADEQVGHRGSALSGGERQRISIARAMLRDPKLLLLDEATSQLDAASEAKMRALIRDVGQQVPIVLVAHRLSTVVDAEQIVVLEDGRIRAVGRHAELLASDPLYRRLVEEQENLSSRPGTEPVYSD